MSSPGGLGKDKLKRESVIEIIDSDVSLKFDFFIFPRNQGLT